jgi:hypothetical protein
MSILEQMTVDDLNMYYSGTMLSVQGRIGIKPFRCDNFEVDNDDTTYAEGVVLTKNKKGEYSRSGCTFDVSKLLTTIPTLGYITTIQGIEWIETMPSSRGYKKGFNMERVNRDLGREGLWNIYNEEYRDFIIEEQEVIYKDINVGYFINEKFKPSHEDFEYLEEYINEEMHR